MFYLQAFINSLYNFKWLKQNRKDMGKAGSYFVFFILAVSVLYAGYAVWKVPKVVNEIRETIKTEVPDFKAEAEEGILNVSELPQPFVYDIPEDNFVIAVDTVTEGDLSMEDYIDLSKESGILVAKDKVIFHDSGQNKTQIQYFKDMPEFSFTKGEIMNWFDKFSTGIPFVLFFVILLVLFVGFVIGKLIYLLLISLIVWFVAYMGKREWPFAEVYTVGLYAITLPTLVNLIVQYFNYSIPYLYSLVLLILMLVAVFYKGNSDEVVAKK